MPELPEVETIRRGLAPAMDGKIIESAQVRRRDLRVAVPRDFARLVNGARVTGTARRGKYILITLSGGHVMVLHMGMSGRMKIVPARQAFTPEKHDHVILQMRGGAKIVMNDPRRFGMLYLAAADGWELDRPFAAMGPEPLGRDFNGKALHERLRGRRTSIKAALLDQGVVAGVGNIYACEALYEAGISPRRIAARVSREEADRLTRAVKSVLRRAIAAGGSSLKDYRQTDGGLGYFQTGFSVYDQEGKPCPACDCAKGVKRITQAGRSSFYCKARQR